MTTFYDVGESLLYLRFGTDRARYEFLGYATNKTNVGCDKAAVVRLSHNSNGHTVENGALYVEPLDYFERWYAKYVALPVVGEVWRSNDGPWAGTHRTVVYVDAEQVVARSSFSAAGARGVAFERDYFLVNFEKVTG